MRCTESIKDINENLGTFIIVKRCDLNYVLYSDSFITHQVI